MLSRTLHGPHEFAAMVGIDWADQKHDLCLLDLSSRQITHSVLEQSPEAIDQWATELRQQFGGRPIAVALELTKGALVYALRKYDFLILYPVPPARLASYRNAMTSSGAKDDPSTARAYGITALHDRCSQV